MVKYYVEQIIDENYTENVYLQFDRIQVLQTEIFPVVFHLYISQFYPYIDFLRYK